MFSLTPDEIAALIGTVSKKTITKPVKNISAKKTPVNRVGKKQTQPVKTDGQINKIEKESPQPLDNTVSGFDDPKYRPGQDLYGPKSDKSALEKEWLEAKDNHEANVRRNQHHDVDNSIPKEELVENSSNRVASSAEKTTSGNNSSYERYAFEKLDNASKGKNYMRERLTREQIGHLNASSDPVARASSAKTLGIEGGADMTESAYRNKVHSYYKDQEKKGPTTMDHVWGHKVPQYATGGLIAVGVVSALANTKGSQSNAQLYGQAPAPGM